MTKQLFVFQLKSILGRSKLEGELETSSARIALVFEVERERIGASRSEGRHVVVVLETQDVAGVVDVRV